jgi:hypothetical protein
MTTTDIHDNLRYWMHGNGFQNSPGILAVPATDDEYASRPASYATTSTCQWPAVTRSPNVCTCADDPCREAIDSYVCADCATLIREYLDIATP